MMDRAQFMRELEELLADISETERQDALEFYNNYFDDAGIENEAAVIRTLEVLRRLRQSLRQI